MVPKALSVQLICHFFDSDFVKISLRKFQLVFQEAAKHFGVQDVHLMFEDKYACYGASYPSPDGNMCRHFATVSADGDLVVDGVPIPKAEYRLHREVEINLEMCNVRQFKGILGKFFVCGETLFLLQ